MRFSTDFHRKLKAAAEACVWHPPMEPWTRGQKAKADRAFGDFWASTSHIWGGIASNLHRKWKPPVGSCGPEDTYNDLAVAVFQLLQRDTYDPHNVGGRNLADYVVFNACNKAKYKLHKLRGANLHGNHDSNPSRAPKSFTEAGIGIPGSPRENYADRAIPITQDALHGFNARVEPNQDSKLFGEEQLHAMLDECDNVRERFGLVALFLCEGDVDEAARTVYDNVDIRRTCHFGSDVQARAAVRRAARLYLEWSSRESEAEDLIEQEATEMVLGREAIEDALAEMSPAQEFTVEPVFDFPESDEPTFDWFEVT